MRLQPGHRLGSYEIAAPLGAGGMGEVYRAKDPKLGRDVAIKVLPAELSGDPDRLARFEREAKALGALNHPNVATVHGFESDGDTHFLVMELVEGEDLATRLKRGPLAVDDAIPLFVQIAEGLEAAHENGLIHRDLKPANVMITKDRRAKVLDFGLARAAESSTADVDLSQSPTRTDVATTGGQILGTAAYMSPEQARGETVDKRSDIWAFGVCFFEALVGDPAFRGDSLQELLAAVLRDPVDLESLPSGTPVDVRRVIARCTVREPRERLRDIGDARIELSGAAGDVSSSDGTEAGKRPVPGWLLAVAGVAAGLALAFLLPLRENRPVPGSPLRYEVDLGQLTPGVTMDDGAIALSPDGSLLAISAGAGPAGRIFLKRRDAVGMEPVSGTHGVWYRSFSPDGEWLLFHRYNEALFRVPVSGGTPLEVRVDSGNLKDTWGSAWDGQDRIILPTFDGLREVSLADGSSRLVTEPETRNADRFPEVLPGGQAILFTRLEAPELAKTSVAVLDRRSGDVRVLVPGALYGRYAHSGHLVYGADGGLFAVSFDVERLEVEGAAVRVVDDVSMTPSYGLAAYSLSESGTLAYVPDEPRSTEVMWVDRQNRAESLPLPTHTYNSPKISPDGRRVAFSADGQVRILDLPTNHLTALTRGSANFGPVWLPDSQSVVYFSNPGGAWELFRQKIGEVGAAEQLTDNAVEEVVTSVVPQTGELILARESAVGMFDLYAWDLETDERRELAATTAGETNGQISPDGAWLAFERWVEGEPEVFVQAYPEPVTGVRQISSRGGRSPVWSPTTNELFFVEGLMRMMSVRYSASDEGFDPRGAELVFERKISASGYSARLFDVSPDGERFLLMSPRSPAPKVVVVENWFEELNDLVPVN